MKEIYVLFQKCFPQFELSEELFNELINVNSCKVRKEYEKEQCIGACVWEGNKIRLLLVEKEHQKQGIGSKLLLESEAEIRKEGHDIVILGGTDSQLFLGAVLNEDEWNRQTSDFFKNRGYEAKNGCIEMSMDLKDYSYDHELSPYPESIQFGYYDGDQDKLREAVTKVEEDWVQYFEEGNTVYVAMDGDTIAAFCILGFVIRLCYQRIR